MPSSDGYFKKGYDERRKILTSEEGKELYEKAIEYLMNKHTCGSILAKKMLARVINAKEQQRADARGMTNPNLPDDWDWEKYDQNDNVNQ